MEWAAERPLGFNEHITLPEALIIIITQKLNSKSKIKVLEKDIKENAATLAKPGGKT